MVCGAPLLVTLMVRVLFEPDWWWLLDRDELADDEEADDCRLEDCKGVTLIKWFDDKLLLLTVAEVELAAAARLALLPAIMLPGPI